MGSLRALRSAPFALALGLGFAGAVRNNDGCARIVMLHGTPPGHAGALARALGYLKRNFRIVPLASLVQRMESGDDRLGRQLALTFDDGLRSNVEIAYPLLARLGLSATFFVCPQLVDEGRWLWNQEARQRLLRLPGGALAELARELGVPAQVEALVQHLKGMPMPGRRALEGRLRDATPGFTPTAAEREALDLASWAELRRLDPCVVDIGSHTLSHPILTSLSPVELQCEIAASRASLEARLGREVEFFAYPNGDTDAAVHAAVRRHYRAAVTTAEGSASPACDLHLLPRLPLPWSSLRLALSLYRATPPGYLAATPSTRVGSQVAI
ncbi:MAG TPA: polysaccharide deacetylase family protein [Burkholderiales bacterium]|nr:polysaccharide deacetylase family protein [Burkholderiales bacterium]